LEQNDITIGVTKQVRGSNLARTGEEIVQKGSAKFVPSDIVKMMESEFGGDFRNAILFAKEKDLWTWLEARPTLDGVSLDNTNVPLEGLGHGEERDGGFFIHGVRSWTDFLSMKQPRA